MPPSLTSGSAGQASQPGLPPLPPHLDPQAPRRRRAAHTDSKRDLALGALFGVRVVAAFLSLAILLGSGYAWASFHSFQQNRRTLGGIIGSGKGIDGTDQNLLLVGNDDRTTMTDAELKQLNTGRDGGSLNTDTMMVIHIPADGSRATLISFPRDSYVNIPGYGMNKLNAAYPIGYNDSADQSAQGRRAAGAALLVKTIEGMIPGLHIDHYAQVDLIGFYRISNAIGGVTVCLNFANRPSRFVGEGANGDPPGIDAGYENGQWINSFSGINLKKGINNNVKGLQALAFVRQRHGLPNGDLDRVRRQQYFLGAVFRKLTSAGLLLNPFKQQDLLRAVEKSITMDSGLDPLKLAEQVQNLQAGNFTLTTIPTLGYDNNTPVGSVVVVDLKGLPSWFAKLTGVDPSVKVKKATAAAKDSFAIKVQNGSGENGIATANAGALKAAGYTQAAVDQSDVPARDATTIIFAAGMEGQAKALLAGVPGAVIEQDDSVKTLTLVIGANKIQAIALMPKPKPVASGTKSSAPAPAPSPTQSNVRTAADASCIN